jgi:hypothetical protein
MNLTTEQKAIIVSINNRTIQSVIDYFNHTFECQIEINDRYNLIEAELPRISPGDQVLIVKNQDDVVIKIAQFYSLCSILENSNLLSIVDIGANTQLPKLVIQGEKDIGYAYYVLRALNKESNKKYIAKPSMEIFIKNEFMTNEESDRKKEIYAREQSEKWTRAIALASIIISLFTTIGTTVFNYMTYTKERDIVIKNVDESIKVEIIGKTDNVTK